jgi:hypothetical protein
MEVLNFGTAACPALIPSCHSPFYLQSIDPFVFSCLSAPRPFRYLRFFHFHASTFYTDVFLRLRFLDSSFPSLSACQPGWPDWANFRRLGDCLVWKLFMQVSEVISIFGVTFFHGLTVCINFDKNRFGQILGDFWRKLIRSPCCQPIRYLGRGCLDFILIC